MPSPFPGMDPWLEDPEYFPDIHDTFITYLREAVNGVLPEGYYALSANRVWVEDVQRRVPDVGVLTRSRVEPDSGSGVAYAALSESGLMTIDAELESDPWEEGYLEIRSASGRRLVTAIEILSPSDKAIGSGGWDSYRSKQREFRHNGVNMVEIDLLRGGTHATLAPIHRLPPAPAFGEYHVCVTLAGHRRTAFLASFGLGERLPEIPIPLDPDHKPVTVAMQPILDRCYDSANYAAIIDYAAPCEPPLSARQKTWADGILRGAGLI